MVEIKKIENELFTLQKKKCNIKPFCRLGSGDYGSIFKYTNSKNSYLIKVVLSKYYSYEFECMQDVYNKVCKYMPDHIIKPIVKYECKRYQLHSTVIEGLVNHVDEKMENDTKYIIMVYNKLGDCTLLNMLKSSNSSSSESNDADYYDNISDFPGSKKSGLEIAFQLIIWTVYVRRYTDVKHFDLDLCNLVLKHNSKPIQFKLKILNCTIIYTLQPEYLCYPIDFGFCKLLKNSELDEDNFDVLFYDLMYLIKHIFRHILQDKDFRVLLKFVEKDNSKYIEGNYFTEETEQNILDSSIFRPYINRTVLY
jgi:hypothetical protein